MREVYGVQVRLRPRDAHPHLHGLREGARLRDAHPDLLRANDATARAEIQRNEDWNQLGIQSRKDSIRVTLNGQFVAQHPGLPDRPKRGPIGLQLHDTNVVVIFRNIRIREVQ